MAKDRVPCVGDKLFVFSKLTKTSDKSWHNATVQVDLSLPQKAYRNGSWETTIPHPSSLTSAGSGGGTSTDNDKNDDDDDDNDAVIYLAGGGTASKKRKKKQKAGSKKKATATHMFQITYENSAEVSWKLSRVNVDLGPHSMLRWAFRDNVKVALEVKRDRGHKHWFFLQSQQTNKLLRMPAAEEDMLVIGRQHCENDLHVSQVAATIQFDSDGTWKLRFIGTNTGLYFKQEKQKKGTKAIVDYNYKLHVQSFFCMLPDGSHNFRIIQCEIDSVLNDDDKSAELYEEVSESECIRAPLKHHSTIEFKADVEERNKAKKAGADPIKERALLAGKENRRKIRHSFVERAFFFPLPCATITFPIKSNTTGWNQTPVVLNAQKNGRVFIQRCGDTQIAAVVNSHDCSPTNCISEFKTKNRNTGRFGWYGCWYNHQNLIRQLVELAADKTSFISLRTFLSDSIPAVWSTSTHLLFPMKFQNAVKTLLMVQHRQRLLSKLAYKAIRAGEAPVGKTPGAHLGSLNLNLLGKVLGYIVQDMSFTDGVGIAEDGKEKGVQLVVHVFVQDRMIQPQVDVSCSKDSVLWGTLHAPKRVASILEQCWENAVTGSPVLTPVLKGTESETRFGIRPLLEAAAPPFGSPVADQPEGFCKELTMHTYQKKALAWMLWRERPQALPSGMSSRLHPAWRCYTLPSGLNVFQNINEQHVWTFRRFDEPGNEVLAKGGILADEMGLGKTVEVISLILANPRGSQKRVPAPATSASASASASALATGGGYSQGARVVDGAAATEKAVEAAKGTGRRPVRGTRGRGKKRAAAATATSPEPRSRRRRKVTGQATATSASSGSGSGLVSAMAASGSDSGLDPDCAQLKMDGLKFYEADRPIMVRIGKSKKTGSRVLPNNAYSHGGKVTIDAGFMKANISHLHPDCTFSIRVSHDGAFSPRTEIRVARSEIRHLTAEEKKNQWRLPKLKNSADIEKIKQVKDTVEAENSEEEPKVEEEEQEQEQEQEEKKGKGKGKAKAKGKGKTTAAKRQAIRLEWRQKQNEMRELTMNALQARKLTLQSEVLPQLRATLIIVPPTLITQWQSEITKHTSDSLKVHVYQGMKDSVNYTLEDQRMYTDTFAEYDIVLTSLEAIAIDAHSVSRSPLSLVEWWRIVLDEAQELDVYTMKGKPPNPRRNNHLRVGYHCYSRSCTDLIGLVCSFRTVNSWCVTGTPVSQGSPDLRKYVSFIDCPIYSHIHGLDMHIERGYSGRTKEGLHLIRRMLQRLMWRNTKESVKTEAELPPIEYKEYRMALSSFERQVYDRRYLRVYQYLQATVASHKATMEETGRTDLQLNLYQATSRFPELFDDLRLACCDPCTASDEDILYSSRRYHIHTAAAAVSGAGGNAGVSTSLQTAGVGGPAVVGGRPLYDTSSSKLRVMLQIIASQPASTKFIVFSSWNSMLETAKGVLADPSRIQPLSAPAAGGGRGGGGDGSGGGGGGDAVNISTLAPIKAVVLQLGVEGQRVVEEFRNEPDVRVLLVCTKAGRGASGLNLTNAHHTILLEPSPDVGLEQQAIGRVHRLGQKHGVVVHRLYAQHTIEDSIQVLQDRRRQLFEARASEFEDVSTDSNTHEVMEMLDLVHLLQ